MAMTRRHFMGAAAAASAGLIATGQVSGANERIRAGIMGLHGRGQGLMDMCLDNDADIEITALCDVDDRVLEDAVVRMRRRANRRPSKYIDVRDMIAGGEIDVLFIAAPNHWHTLAAIWACEAGVDVYVEKPLSHTVWEGRQLAAAAQKYGRIVQHGTHERSNPKYMRDIALLKKGALGPLHMARAVCYKTGNRHSIGHEPNEAPPSNLDWTLWQGPAPERPYCANYHPYNWHWFWDYGNGEIGNQGVHQMDIATWGLGRRLPVKAASTGGRFAWKDQGETPNTQIATLTFADGAILTFEVRNLGSYGEAGRFDVGNSFFGSEGYYLSEGGFYDYDDAELDTTEAAPQSPGPVANFVKAVRSRKPADIHGSALDGHIASACCHLANIAFRLGETLTFDPQTERFVGNEAANKLLTRTYREGFEVPDLAQAGSSSTAQG